MSTPVVQGRTTSPGGGETQTATPRILAAELEQRRRKDPGKADRGEEQRKAEEARATVQAERSEGGGTLDDDEWVSTDTPERWGPSGEPDEPGADDGDDWFAEQQRQADAALVSAVRALAPQLTTSRAPIHDLSGKTAACESRASPIREPEKESIEAEWREWNEWAAEEQRRALAGDVLWCERGEVSGQGASEVTQGEPEPQEQPLDDDHNAEVEEMEVDLPLVQHKKPRSTNTSWAVGSNIALQHRYLVQEAYDAHRRYSPGEEVAFITGQLRHQYRIAEMKHGTSGIEDSALSDSRLELKHGSGQLLTWEQHGRIRQLYTQCSRRPGEVIGPRDIIYIRSHRSRTSMHFEGDVVAVPFIWQTGQQGFRYAKVCWKDALIEASTKGLYQLDGGAHNPKMLRARGSFYAIDRNSPTREWLEEEDILEVPGRRGARLQDEWDGLSPGQELEPWSTPTCTDL
jgi:hypothetical protein